MLVFAQPVTYAKVQASKIHSMILNALNQHILQFLIESFYQTIGLYIHNNISCSYYIYAICNQASKNGPN